MTILTFIYAADITAPAGENWHTPEYGKFFDDTIKGKSIICGRKTFQSDWQHLLKANHIVILSSSADNADIWDLRRKVEKSCDNYVAVTKMEALQVAWNRHDEEIFCVGGAETFAALAPFASKLIITQSFNPEGGGDPWRLPWMPQYLVSELELRNLFDVNLWQEKIAERAKTYWRKIFTRRLPIDL